MVIVKTAVAGISQQALARFTQRAGKAAGVRGQANVLITSSREVHALNRRFRGHDKPTDVLSFPPADSQQPPSAGDRFSGEIVISCEIAARNARLFRHTAAQEIKILILHGLLHLAGYDHESDRGEMARREEKLRRELGLSDGLIRRSQVVAHAPSRVQPAGRGPSTASQKRRVR